MSGRGSLKAGKEALFEISDEQVLQMILPLMKNERLRIEIPCEDINECLLRSDVVDSRGEKSRAD